MTTAFMITSSLSSRGVFQAQPVLLLGNRVSENLRMMNDRMTSQMRNDLEVE